MKKSIQLKMISKQLLFVLVLTLVLAAMASSEPHDPYGREEARVDEPLDPHHPWGREEAFSQETSDVSYIPSWD